MMPRFPTPVLVSLLALAVASHADAKKSSGNGVPCGNSYISADKVCHIGVPAPSPAPLSTAPLTTPAAPAPGSAPFFKSCSDARAAGFTDIPRSSPAYRSELDRDHDGVACERNGQDEASAPVPAPAGTSSLAAPSNPTTALGFIPMGGNPAEYDPQADAVSLPIEACGQPVSYRLTATQAFNRVAYQPDGLNGADALISIEVNGQLAFSTARFNALSAPVGPQPAGTAVTLSVTLLDQNTTCPRSVWLRHLRLEQRP